MFAARFRFRAADRDKRSDEERITSIRNVIRGAVSGAELELVGLSRRVEEFRAQAAFLFGSEQDPIRDPHDETQLSEAEARLLAAERRIGELKDHLARLSAFEETFVERFR